VVCKIGRGIELAFTSRSVFVSLRSSCTAASSAIAAIAAALSVISVDAMMVVNGMKMRTMFFFIALQLENFQQYVV